MNKVLALAILALSAGAGAAPVIVNGDFATGTLDGWSWGGPVSVVDQAAYLQEVTLSNTQLSQTFTIPSGATKLTFDFAFDSTPAGDGQDGPEEFFAYLLDPANSQPILHIPGYQEFLYVTRTGFRDYDPAILTLTDLGGALPWVRANLSFASLSPPRNARLVLSLSSWGDDGFDTRLAVDNVAVATPTPHPGDANNDGFVDVGDLGILAFNWGLSDRSWSQANFTTPDTVVDVGDLGILAFNWGWVGTPPEGWAAPEPAVAILILVGALALRRRLVTSGGRLT